MVNEWQTNDEYVKRQMLLLPASIQSFIDVIQMYDEDHLSNG